MVIENHMFLFDKQRKVFIRQQVMYNSIDLTKGFHTADSHFPGMEKDNMQRGPISKLRAGKYISFVDTVGMGSMEEGMKIGDITMQRIYNSHRFETWEW